MSEIREELVLVMPGVWTAYHLDDSLDAESLVRDEVESIGGLLADPAGAAAQWYGLLTAARDRGEDRLAVLVRDTDHAPVLISQRRDPVPDLITGWDPQDEVSEVGYYYVAHTGLPARDAETIEITASDGPVLGRRQDDTETTRSEFWILTPTGSEVVRIAFEGPTSDGIHDIGLRALETAEWIVDRDEEPEAVPDPEPSSLEVPSPPAARGPVSPPLKPLRGETHV